MARTTHGDSVLMRAIGDPECPTLYRDAIVALLLKKGAASDIDSPNLKGKTPLSFARKHGLCEIEKMFEKQKLK